MSEGRTFSQEADNVVKYELYLSKPPDQALVDHYKQYVTTAILHDSEQEFNLTVHKKQNLCYGCVKFGTNIEEEWLVVHILYELSKHDKDLVIRVYDNDGDILLIEAAEYLPRWLESSKSKNRVFIYDGKLHIIPENINLKDLTKIYTDCVSTTQAAAHFIREINRSTNTDSIASQTIAKDTRIKTLASTSIQEAIEEQLSGMPDKNAWLSKKYKQLDEIISENNVEDVKHLEEKFRESLTLAALEGLNEDELQVSPFSSAVGSSSSSWEDESMIDQQVE